MNTLKIRSVLPLVALLFAFTTTLFTSPAAQAGMFTVSPVRIYMKPKDRAIAITLTNEGDEPIALQADINVWSQKPDGTDELVLTEDLILSPPVINLAPKAKQVVRLALLRPIDPEKQLIYRMIVREVPEIAAPKNRVEVPIALALSLPVFVTPPIAQYEVECSASRQNAKTIKALCKNTGTAYSQIREILVVRNNATLARMEGGIYLLPGASKSVEVHNDKAVTAGPAQLKVTFDDGKTLSFDAVLP